jgi:hypothetical protein
MAVAPTLTASTSTPRDYGSANHSGDGPISAEWALVIVTAVLAWFTFWLWNATRKLVTDAKETAKRQLRAYVHVSEMIPTRSLSATSMPAMQVIIKNFGQTPAYRLRIETKTLVDRVAQPTLLAFPERLKLGSTHVLAPGGVFAHHTDGLNPSDTELQAIRALTHRIYLIGAIEYTDAFGDFRRETVRNSLNASNLVLEVEAEGNESSLEVERPKA